MNRRGIQGLAVLLALALMISTVPLQRLNAAEGICKATTVNQFLTSNSSGTDYVKISTRGSIITMKYRSILPGVRYRLLLRKVGVASIVAEKKDIDSTNDGFIESLDVSEVPNGTYYLLLTRAGDESQAFSGYIGGSRGYTFIGMPIKVNAGKAAILEYKKVIQNNQNKRAASAKKGTKCYLDQNLSDISFVFQDPVTGRKAVGTTEEKARKYFKKVSDSVCKGATTKYQKMQKIYEYVASNFYYDTVAFQESKGQYINPYLNLYHLRNNIKSKNSVRTNTGTAKVATTCIGFGAMVIALARAQKIPAKAAYGHALTSPWNTWSTEKSTTSLDHWWAEAYVGGRWIVVDATRGTNAKWDRRQNTWTKLTDGVLTYHYFDPSITFLSNTHLYQGYK